MELTDLKWPDVAALSKDTPIVIPVAALEQHGRHMPVFTDSMLLGEIVRRTVAALDDPGPEPCKEAVRCEQVVAASLLGKGSGGQQDQQVIVVQLVEAVGLSAFAELPAVELPYGRKRALEIATTLALEPEMLLLDEPMAGLGQEDIKRIAQLIRTVAKDRTVLMVEHNMSVVADLSDTITVLARGEVLAEGPYASVSKNPLVVEAYVGTGHG